MTIIQNSKRDLAFGRMLAIANVLSERVFEKGTLTVTKKYMARYRIKPFDTLVKIHADLHEHAHKFGETELQLLDLFGEILSTLDEKDCTNEMLKPVYLHAYHSEQHQLNQIMGTEEASKLWDLSQDHIKRLCRDGKLQCVQIGKTWVLDRNQPNPKGM